MRVANDEKSSKRLIERVAQGDRDAFFRLYDATAPRLLGFCVHLLRDRKVADAALQDTFVKVWKRADQFAVSGLSADTWLLTLARNSAIDHHRIMRKITTAESLGDSLPLAAMPEDGATIAQVESHKARQSLRRMDEAVQAAVKAAYLEGHNYADLSAQMSSPVASVRDTLRQALLDFRASLVQ